MHRKGDFRIPSNRFILGIVALSGLAFVLLLVFSLFWNKPVDISPIQENQEKISLELQTKTDSILSSLNLQRDAINLLNQNIVLLEKNKASDESVKALQSEVLILTRNIENNGRQIELIHSQMQSIEENIKIIEPSYVQNVDMRDLRSTINIFNFRLIINFFIALTISLFTLEVLKFFGDFLSFAYYTKNRNLRAYIDYKKSLFNQKIAVFNHHKDGAHAT